MQKNVVCWADIAVLDLDRAMEFYSKVIGTKLMKVEAPDGIFAIFPHDDCGVGACLSAEAKPSENGALVYLDVTGFIDEAAARIPEAGGKILKPKTKICEYGYRVIFIDSEGNRVALYSAPEEGCCCCK